jgi:polysaccharide chain length determinant protein (PEP-CTERM system associated)
MAHSPADPARSLGLKLALEVLKRRKWLALSVFVAAASAGVTLALSLPDLYRATATVLVERQHVSEELVRSSVTAELETRIHTIQQDVESRARLTDMIARLGLYPELRLKFPIDAIVERMRRDINLDLKGADPVTTGRSGTISFTLDYSGRNPQTVAIVANELAQLYVAENMKMREGQALGMAAFLKGQLADVKKQLDAQDQRVTEFKLSHLGELPQQVSANLSSLERLNTQLRLNGEGQIRAMDRRDRLEKQLADAGAAAAATPPAAPGVDPAVPKLRQQLDELRRQFTDEYPDVIRVKAELAALERQTAAHPVPASTAAPAIDGKTRLMQAIGDASTELRALKDEEVALRQAISGYEQRVDNVPKRQEEFQTMSRDYETTKERYDTLLKRYEEARLAASLEQGQNAEQFRILDPAIPPRDPSAPSRSRLLLLAIMVSIALAVAAMLVTEKLDTSFHDGDDLRAFISVPTLFSIPLIFTAAETRQKRRRVAVTAVSFLIALGLIVAGSRYVASGNEGIAKMMGRGA